MNRRAQVTLFMTIGIVLLIMLFVAVQFRSQIFRVDETKTIDITPSGFQGFVESCLEETALDAVQRMGDQGGFVDIPSYVADDGRRYFSLGEGAFKLPLWYFDGKETMPTIVSMEENLAYYIQSNIGDCFDNFDAFKYRYDVEQKNPPLVTGSIGENDVTVRMNFEVELSSMAGNETTQYRDFYAVVPVRLRKIYGLARDIMETENSEFLFEKTTVDLMSIDPEIPFTGMEFTCQPKRWYVQDVKQRIKDILFYNLPRSRFQRTDYPPFIASFATYEGFRGYDAERLSQGDYPSEEPPEDAYDYFHLFFDVTDDNYRDMRASVEFLPSADFEFNVKPNSNGLMKSNTMKGASKYMNFICSQFYHFTYDIRYMLRVNIFDPESLEGRGYKFSFAFPVVIRSNHPDRRATGLTVFDSPVIYSDPCTDFTTRRANIRAVGIFEGYDNVDLDKVNISYACLTDGCFLGETEAYYGTYELQTRIPTMCVGGFITASREGYLTAKKQYNGEEYFEIRLKKTAPFNVQVKKRLLTDMDTDLELAEYEKVFAYISSEEDGISYFEEFAPGEQKVLELVAEKGYYDVDFILVDTVYDQIWGGYKGNWTYDYEDAASAATGTVTLHVLEYEPKPVQQEKKFEMMDFLENNQEYKKKLAPTFS